MHLLFSITSIEMYFMSGICAFVAFVANLIKKYEKWKVLASGFDGVRVAHLFSFLYCAVCFPPCLSLFLSGTVYQMLPVSLDSPFLILPSVLSNVYLPIQYSVCGEPNPVLSAPLSSIEVYTPLPLNRLCITCFNTIK